MVIKLMSREAWNLLRQTASDWSEDNVPRLGAALSFYTALSIAPLLVLSLRVAASVFGEEAARGEIESQIQSMIGEQGAEAIQSMLQSANQPETGTWATILGLVTLLFGASGVFGQLQESLNTIWDVTPKPGQGLWSFIRYRFFSMAMVMSFAFLLLVSLIISAGLSFAGGYLFNWLSQFEGLTQAANFVASLLVFTLLFAMMFKYVPDAEIKWKDVWLGAFMTAVLFNIGKFVIGLYLGRTTFASSYGVAGSLIVLLVWVYYSAQIIFFGAEFTQVYANRYGGKIVPAENAELVPDQKHPQNNHKPDSRRNSSPASARTS
ncbi:YihY/virulence factor BrkB family protein [Schlesneria sp. T3-172]|uniref:YihY/virulence factor BrkB family protein n=1 Tax=Schlesneria TaxID=656899 RepID=UPI002F1D39E2